MVYTQLWYVALIFALFVVPKLLQRYRLPAAITAFLLGAASGMGLDLFRDDQTLHLLSTFGIVSLFLFAGLEVDVSDLRRGARVILQHLVIAFALMAAVAWAAAGIFDLEIRAAALVSLALLTPSAGFILDSIRALGVSEEETFWIRSKAIATEILALGTLFVALQSTTATRLSLSALALAAMVAILPLLFRVFAAWVVPHAPRSEFAFLLMVAVLCAFATWHLGVYYLVGAFVVGLGAQRFREELPAMASEEMVHAVELFASFFVPFYFFNAGLHLRVEDFTPWAILTGAAFLVAMIPLRIAQVVFHRRFALGERLGASTRIGAWMLPTFIFTLVLAEILRDRFDAPPHLFAGLIIYTIANTLIPGLFFKVPTPEFDHPHAAEIPPPPQSRP